MPFCFNCGAKLPDNAAFCANCGAASDYNCIVRCISDHPGSYTIVDIEDIDNITLKSGEEKRVTLPVGVRDSVFTLVRGHGFTLTSNKGKYNRELTIEDNKILDITVRIGRITNNIDIKSI